MIIAPTFLNTWSKEEASGQLHKNTLSITSGRPTDLTYRSARPMACATTRTRLVFGWAPKLNTKIVTGNWLDIFWISTLVNRRLILRVDGDQLPSPRPEAARPGDDDTEYVPTVTPQEVDIAHVVYTLQSNRAAGYFDSHLAGVGFAASEKLASGDGQRDW